jgi:putrescine transport system substrate-binding protein
MKTSLAIALTRLSIAPLSLAALTIAAPVVAQDQVVNVYNWSDYIAEDTVANFQEETGITVNYSTYSSNEELEARLFTGSSGFDIVVPSGSFLERQIAAELLQPIDKSLLSNYGNLSEVDLANAAAHDPDNTYAIPYMSFTVGIGYNVAAVEERLGADQPIDTWDVLFDPEIAAQLADCGIAILDSPSEVVGTALNYLGLDPNTTAQEDLDQAEALLLGTRPHVRYFDSARYIDDLASGEICVALGYSGDVFIAADSAAEGIEVNYVIPREGALTAYDLLAIPADAPNVANAHAFIDYIMRPEVTAAISNYVFYASANEAATEFVDAEVRDNPGIYPPAEVAEAGFSLKAREASFDRLLTRAWTRIKTGQ